jgi:glucokinase-like ROK family protein
VLSMTAQVLQIIRRAGSPLSKAEIATQTGISLSAVSDHIERLLVQNIIVASNIGVSSGGRKPKQYSLNAGFGCILSVEMGTAHAQVALTDFDCRILFMKTSSIRIDEGPEAVLNHIYTMVKQLMEDNGIEKVSVKGIGMGIPGPVEFSTGRPISPPIMPGWDGYPIKSFWSAFFECPCYVDNDVNNMALGEYSKGLSFGTNNMIYVKVGTGIGSGLIYDGRLYRGATGGAGDIGHFDVGSPVMCWCGNKGCLEAAAGGKAIVTKAQEMALAGKSEYLLQIVQEKGTVGVEHIEAGLLRLDPVSIELVRESGSAIGRVLAAIVNFSNPSLISIGGRVSEFGDLFLAAIRQSVYHRSLPLATRNLVINKSVLGSSAGVIGGAFMTIDQLIIQATDEKVETFPI